MAADWAEVLTMTTTPDAMASRAPSRDSALGLELARYGAASALVVTAAVAAIRYGWFLLHEPTDFSSDLEPGWQVTAAKVGIGCLIVALGVVGGLLAQRFGRALNDRTPHARAVRFASVLPGVLLGVGALHPIYGTLNWASNHTSQGIKDRAADNQMLAQIHREQLESRTAPPQMHTLAPAAPAAFAARLVSPKALGAGWYSLRDPAVTSHPPQPTAKAAGATKYVSTNVATAVRDSTGWQLKIYLIEGSTSFGTAPEAGRYLSNYGKVLAAPCDCLVSEPPPTVSGPRVSTIAGIKVDRWIVKSDVDTSRQDGFSVGRRAYTLSINHLDGTTLSTAERARLIRIAVVTAKTAR